MILVMEDRAFKVAVMFLPPPPLIVALMMREVALFQISFLSVITFDNYNFLMRTELTNITFN